MGSSGIRAGASGSATIVRSDFDYLGEWWARRSLDGAEPATVAALRALPLQAGFPADCDRIGGGFSAWRLAAQAAAGDLAELLGRIHQATGVAVLVIPQRAEGGYGYLAARQLLGSRLGSTHVLDIGGGSLQISGALTSYGDALGQKIWQRELCRALRRDEATPCSLQPMSQAEVAAARQLLAERLQPLGDALAAPVTLTAISRPVSRGVMPAVAKIAAGSGDSRGFERRELSRTIDRLAPLTLAATMASSGIGAPYASYLLSDMLLVEGVLLASGGDYLQVAEIDLTNAPGLLADDRAFAWAQRYGCYLSRLRSLGAGAYDSPPDTCQR